MEPTNWAPEHSDALRRFFAQRLSFSEIAAAINKEFKTSYSRNAMVSRAMRMGLAGQKRPELPARRTPSLNRLGEIRPAEPNPPRFHWPLPAIERTEIPKLRCVEIEPRHLSLIELERGDCRYPLRWATKRGRRLPSAVIRVARVRATARRISISAAVPAPVGTCGGHRLLRWLRQHESTHRAHAQAEAWIASDCRPLRHRRRFHQFRRFRKESIRHAKSQTQKAAQPGEGA